VHGALAGFLVYRLRGDRIVLVHTEVFPEFEGAGVGSGLARHALEDARSRGLGVVPRCPFVLAYLRRHPEYAADVVGGRDRIHDDQHRGAIICR
jgi:predicted GNAT family acetyltransferase